MKKMRVGIYGGTFNPPHIGHVGAAEAFLRAANLDKLIIMPDNLPPHKEFSGNVSALDRFEMCKLAFSHIPNTEVSNFEILKGGKSYTVLTLEAFSSPDVELFFLCGTDMFLSLRTWFNPRRIFELATICCVRRETDPEITERISELKTEYISEFNARIIDVPLEVTEISSSALREALTERSYTDYIQSAVFEYILKKELYL